MASPYQQQARQRKFIYLGAILALFTASWAWREYVVARQAADVTLAATEANQGEVELDGAALRLTLTGSRGLTTCGLWFWASKKQERHQWNELSLIIKSLTKLQPHFVTPWLFQSWNLAYNVSVESDRVSDKYFYISEGLKLLAEGERQNRDQPDLRFYMGFYGQHKLCQSDETNTFRSLFQLSCIPPNERDPARFLIVKDGRQEINEEELMKFCEEHPQLARRLREGIRLGDLDQKQFEREKKRQFTCGTAEALVAFLAENYRLPSVYEEVPPAAENAWQKKPAKLYDKTTDRFPLLPPPPGSRERPQAAWAGDPKPLTRDTVLTDSHDPYLVARAWYGYAQEALPPPDDVIPGESKPVRVHDGIRVRKNKNMATVIFRNYPARLASFTAERLQQEGWFDGEGYELDWFKPRTNEDGSPKPFVVGARLGNISQQAWSDAYDMWKEHGLATHLLFESAEAEHNTRELAQGFYRAYNLPEGSMVPQLREDQLDPETARRYRAARVLGNYESSRRVSNFNHHLQRARVEAEADTVQARKLFFKAEHQYLNGSLDQALETYRDPRALEGWKKILLTDGHAEFRDDTFIQDQTCWVQAKYLDLANYLYKLKLKGVARVVPLVPPTSETAFPESILPRPFRVPDARGTLLISDATWEEFQQRRIMSRPKPGQPVTPAQPQPVSGGPPK